MFQQRRRGDTCGPRLHSTCDPEGHTISICRDNLTDVQLEAADGSPLVLLTAWLSHPLIESLQSLVSKARRSRGKGNPPANLGTPGFLPKPPTSDDVQGRPTEVGATRGGSHHAPRLRSDQCMLCRQVEHRASECPSKGKATAFSPDRRAFGTYALGCAVFVAP